MACDRFGGGLPSGRMRDDLKQRRGRVTSAWKCHFHSEEEVLGHWCELWGDNAEILATSLRPGAAELDLVYTPSCNRHYVVSLASPSDATALCELSDEFVTSHSALFAREYPGVDHKTWCHYLGLHAALDRRRQATVEVARQNLSQASRYNFHAMCSNGCTLKLEYRCTSTSMSCGNMKDIDEGEVPVECFVEDPCGEDEQLGSRLRGDEPDSLSVPNSTVRKTALGRDACGGDPLQTCVVGYVHFSMEEGTAPGAPRVSKRLKRKRGESTGEYVKISHIIVKHSHRGLGLGTLLLTAVLHRVACLEPSFAREMFLTVLERNVWAIGLYQRLGLSIIGKNITYLGKNKSQPIMWYQMGVERGNVDIVNREITEEDGSTTASTSSTMTPASGQSR